LFHKRVQKLKNTGDYEIFFNGLEAALLNPLVLFVCRNQFAEHFYIGFKPVHSPVFHDQFPYGHAEHFLRQSYTADYFETNVSEFETNVSEFETIVSEFETIVSELKTFVSEFETFVSELKTFVSELKTTVARLKRILFEVKGFLFGASRLVNTLL
jgi:exonuclease VII small subunit